MKTLPATALGSRSADFNRTIYHLDVDPSVSIDDLLRPNFWAHHAANLKRGDVIDVLTLDGSYDVTLRVTGSAIGMVAMRPLRIWQRDEPVEAAKEPEDEIPAPEGYKVSFAPKTLWRVMTEEPVMEISRDHKSRADATRAAIAHATKANAAAA